jgi:hypothetical protein
MIPSKYSPENLRKLMAESPGYKDLTPEAKANIEAHIQDNNESVLLYIFQELRDEARSHEESRDELTKSILSFASDDDIKDLGKKLEKHIKD